MADAAETPAPKTWLITGASSGFGRPLALAAIAAGHKVVGTTPDVAKAETECPEFATSGGIWLELTLSQRDALDKLDRWSEEHSIDVVVNSVGLPLGSTDEASGDGIREANYYGPLRVIKACLPTMRAKRAGSIVLISSGAGSPTGRREQLASHPVNSSSKYAIEAAHESLQHELKETGINVLIAQPGAIRPEFTRRVISPARYESSLGGYSNSSSKSGTAVDPEKVAQAIYKAVIDGHEYLRLPLGSDCFAAPETKKDGLLQPPEATPAMLSAADVD